MKQQARQSDEPTTRIRSLLLVSVLCLGLFGAPNLLAFPVNASGWHIETVDSAGNVGKYSSIALDGSGYPHISYYSSNTGYLKYAYQNGNGWHIETVDATGCVCVYTSIAVDEAGYSHISYFDGTNRNLKYAYQDGSGWHIETVDSSNQVSPCTSIVLDASGYPHIGYDTWDGVKYAYQDGSGWHIETIDSGTDYVSIAVDASGDPHVSYNYYSDLRYAYRDAAGWHIEVVDSAGGVSQCTAIALDGSDRPCIGYFTAASHSDLRYAHYTGTAWQIETLRSDLSLCGHISMAVDRNNYPHMSYIDGSSLKYAYKDAGGWHSDVEVDTCGSGSGANTSVATDATRNPHISYYDYINGDLKYAYYTPSEPALSKSNGSLDFGTTATSKTFDIWNSGSGTLNYTISDNRSWIGVSPTSGSSSGEADPITVTVNRSGLSPGHYTGTVTINPNYGSDQTVSVSMDVPCPPPGNDDLANAQTISGNYGTVAGSNACATKETGEPNHAGNSGGASVWYKWIAPFSGRVVISTGGSNFDTLLAVYTGSSVGSLNTIVSNDDGGPGTTSRVSFTTSAGTTYKIAVDGYSGHQGNLVLSWSPDTEAVFRVEHTGNVFADGPFYGTHFYSGSADVAEWVPMSEPVKPGDVLELDPNNPGHYRKSRGPCSDLVAGVVSTEPGFILGSSSPTVDSGPWTDDSRPVTEDSALLALVGIVPVKVTDEGGPIQPGDLLVTSSTPGHAMRWDPNDNSSCDLVGKALESVETGTGIILVLLTAH